MGGGEIHEPDEPDPATSTGGGPAGSGEERPPLAAILAGGRSRRFGAPKPFADLAGRPLLEWVRRAVVRGLAAPVLIANDPDAYARFGLRCRPDVRPGSGPLSGIHAALLWAEEQGRPGALCVACDTPFLHPALLRRLVERFARARADVVAPQSRGPRGVEPLCAVYSTRCAPEIGRRIEAGEHALGALVGALRTEIVDLADVERFGDPEVMFLNVNTREQYRRARELATRMLDR